MRSILSLSLLALLASSADSQNLFGVPLEVSSPCTRVGDFNGDGLPDGLMSRGGSKLGILRNTGGAVFVEGPLTDMGDSGLPELLNPSVGDWNGDGSDDVAFTSFVTSELFVSTSDGVDTLSAPLSIVTVQGLSRVRMADFNDDGMDEIVVLGQNDLALYENQAGVPVLVDQLALTPLFSALALSDLDGDGVPEIIVAGAESDTMLVVTFGNDTLVAGDTYGLFPGLNEFLVEIVPGDLDADGDEDLLVALLGGSDDRLVVFENTGGPLLVQGPSNDFEDLIKEIGFDNLSLGDWDADGDLDLLGQGPATFSSELRVRALENLGGGVFAYSFNVFLGVGGRAAGVADFDEDGNLDFLANQTLVFGDGTLTSPLALDLPSNERPTFAQDFEGEGDVDLIDFFDSSFDDIYRYTNDGTGEFVRSAPMLPEPIPSVVDYDVPAAFGDFDGDGVAELLVSVSQVVLFQRIHLVTRRFVDDGTGTFVDGGNAGPLGVEVPLDQDLLADMDGDGDLDVLGGGSIWFNDGAGFFPAATVVVNGGIVGAVDRDLDGDVDLVVREVSGTTSWIRLATNDGSGNFSSAPQAAHPTSQTFRFANYADIDADGDLDLVLVTTQGSSSVVVRVYVVETVPGGVLPQAQVGQFFAPHGMLSIELGEVNGDGRADLLIGRMSSSFSGANRLFVLMGEAGQVGFEEPVEYLTSAVHDYADVDSDGDLDLVGRAVFRNRSIGGAGAGVIAELGRRDDGARPVLGSTGPLREGETVELRLRRGLGGSLAILARGTSAVNFVDAPFVGLTTWVGSIFSLEAVPLSGTVGQPLAGKYSQAVTLPPGIAGSTYVVQGFVLDPSHPSGWVDTNGLLLEVGG